MKGHRWIYPAFGMLTALMVMYFAMTKKTRETFFGMSPGTLTQLQSSHVATMPAPGVLPDTLLVPQQHRFKPFGAENAALTQTPLPYLII